MGSNLKWRFLIFGNALGNSIAGEIRRGQEQRKLESVFDKAGIAYDRDANGNVIGSVCSGGFGPTLGGPLAMGYLDSAYTALDTPVWAIVRGKKVQMLVSKMPFVPQRYYRG